MDVLNRFINTLFKYKNLGLFPVFMLLGIYIIPALIGVFALNDSYAWLFLVIFSISIISYLFFYYLFSFNKKILQIKSLVPSHLGIILIFGSYLIFFLYVALTAPHLPISDGLQGKSAAIIANDREEYLKARQGYEAILPYINALFTSVFVPYIIATCYLIKHKWRHLLLIIFIGTLLVSLEKALIVKALLPLIVLMINGNIKIKTTHIKKIFVLMLAIIMLAGFLAHSSFGANNTPINLTKDRYHLVPGNNTISYMANRAFWIPYITAYDWLRYFDIKRENEYFYGSTSSFLSLILHEKRVNVEEEVFSFEWGQTATGTGSSNTGFFIESYVNFGWFGIIFYSFLLACMTSLFVRTRNIAAKAVYYYFIFMLAISSFIGVLFGNGLLFLIFFALLKV